ncbi:MAG: hypothetical protein IIA60_08415 [Candidatus Marinimicrobia bacterium]|nr:hypothetical protein [Candidatus Neomarinimicrobiota bacterium]
MAGVKETIDDVSGWLKSIIEFGLSIIMVFVVIDILFGSDWIVGNINAIVASFADKGVVGLIALFLFMLIYRK